jgi:O-antigen ligase
VRSRSRDAQAPPAGAAAGERVTFLLAAALVVLLPLLWSSESLEAFRGPKRELALVLWATLAAVFLTGAGRAAAWRDPWWAAWAGVIAGAVLSAPASGHPGVVLVRTLPLVLAALGWGALRRLSEASRQRLATLVVIAGVVQAAAAALLVLPAFQPEAFGRIEALAGRYRWIGTLGNPADVGVYLVLPLLLAAALALARRRRRWPPALAAALMLAVVIGTRTLSAAIALAGGGAVLLLRHVPRRLRGAAVAGVLAVALVAALVGPLAPRVQGALREFKHGGWTAIGSGRGAGYAAALGMIAARPAFGVGFGLFESNSFAFQDEDVLARRARTLRLETAFGQAHNEVLQHAAETGLLGLALAAAGIAWAARRGRAAAAPLPARLPLLAAVAVLSLLQFPLHLAAIAAQWTVLAALALPPLPAAPRLSARRRLAAWLAVAAVAAAASYAAWQRHRGSIAWQQASTLVEVIRWGRVGQGGAEAARAALERIEERLAWFPGAWSARVVAGNVAMLAGRREAALAHFDAALRLAERPETRFNVGMALLALGDQEAGYAHLIRAVKLNPWMFAQVTDPAVAAALRRRLDADGYGLRQAWMYGVKPDKKAPP